MNIFDVVVIGGGPAGMMAASFAAQKNNRVLLLEKNATLGKKLLITGGGRFNVTNNKPVVREMLSQYKTDGKFLFSTFVQHGVADTIKWFADRGVSMKEENEGRLFPDTEKAETIQQALVAELEKRNVQVQTGSAVRTIKSTKDRFDIELQNGKRMQTRTCIVATGGTARPETGSTGEGFGWLEQLGHTTIPNSYALVPITLKSTWTAALSGISISDCKLTIRIDDKKHSVHQGKLLFTHVGMTGPTILNLSKTIGELLQYHNVVIGLNLFPSDDAASMDQKLQSLFQAESNKKLRNALSSLVPMAIAKVVLEQCQIDGEQPCNGVSRVERIPLGQFLQSIPLPVGGLLSKDKAVISAGGVRLEEVDFKTMESRIVPGLFLVGEMLNINRPSGGYSLQLCWSTGAVAGMYAGK